MKEQLLVNLIALINWGLIRYCVWEFWILEFDILHFLLVFFVHRHMHQLCMLEEPQFFA